MSDFISSILAQYRLTTNLEHPMPGIASTRLGCDSFWGRRQSSFPKKNGQTLLCDIFEVISPTCTSKHTDTQSLEKRRLQHMTRKIRQKSISAFAHATLHLFPFQQDNQHSLLHYNPALKHDHFDL